MYLPDFSDKMRLGSKGRKSGEGLLAGGFLNLGPDKNMSKQPFLGGTEYERSETLDEKLDQGTGCWNFDRRDSSAFCYGSGKRMGQ